MTRRASGEAGLLVLLVLLTALPYVGGLGFYNDDWSFLSAYRNSSDASLLGLASAGDNAIEEMRPVKIVYQATLYRAFGLDPLGYHVVNTIVLAVAAVLLYLALTELGLQPSTRLAVPALWAVLPHYATDRFWFAAFQANLSMALAFLSLFAALRALRAISPSPWRCLGTTTLVASGLAYEVALPLLAAQSVLVAWHGRTLHPSRRPAWSLLVDPVGVLGVIAFKLTTPARLEAASAAGYADWMARNAAAAVSWPAAGYERGLNLWRALDVSFGDYVVRLPLVAARLAPRVGPAGVVVALAVAWLLYLALARGTRTELDLPPRAMAGLVVGGAVVFVLGYAVFLASGSVELTASGIGNRTACAAAVGVSLAVVGATGLLARVLPDSRGPRAFAAVLATYGTACVIVIQALASYWIEAYRQEQRILAAIAEDLPVPPSGRSLILTGACQYVGPATVFEASWDLEAALQTLYHDPTLSAEVVTPETVVGDEGLRTSLYGREKVYPFERSLFYDARNRTLSAVDDAAAARRLLDGAGTGDCPPGRIGHGVSVF